MALESWQRTQEKIIFYLQEKGRPIEWLERNCLLDGEEPEDLKTLLDDMKVEGTIHQHYSIIHLITPESEARREAAKMKKEGKVQKANAWAFYALHPDSDDFRQQLRANFTFEDGKVFKALAAILCRERLPRAGERVAGPLTEEEGTYISKVNEGLQAFLRERE
jgi:hypothetical protein